MKKRKHKTGWLAFLLAAVMLLAMIPTTAFAATASTGSLIVYSGHQQTYGNLPAVSDGTVLGITGQSKRLEAVSISKGSALSDVEGSIQYRVHVQSYGTMGWVSDGTLAGTTGQSKRIEAIQIRLTGELSEQYDIYYSMHIQKYGWTKWTKGLSDGDSASGTAGWCGTNGLYLRAEAIQIVLVEKGGSAPSNSGSWSYLTKSDLGSISYSGHQQTYGNLSSVSNGTTLGVTGQSKRMEAVSISLSGGTVSGGVKYRTHVQSYGWQSWVSNGASAGTTGQSKRMEAIQIQLTGDIANYCDVWYRVHVQGYGWLGWAKNGQTAGTTGISYRIEAIQIQIVPKEAPAPGANSGYYKDTPIITSGRVVKNGNIYYYNSSGTLYRTVYGNQKMVALTYDDGPSEYTTTILDTLEKYNSKATFFVVGERVGSYSSIVKRAYNLGCQIGNHTYNHTTLTTASVATIQSQISLTNNAVKSVTGVSPTIMRPPGGAYNATVRSTVGMPLILWSIDTLDWKTRNSVSTVNSVLNNVKDGDIVLMHDLYQATATASLTIIPSLVSRGYQLVTVEEMALLRGGMSNGVVYSSFR
ncbi:MAG: polysaccharide deacetylase family protein [Clostridiales bacterium]|nr:polysaccharide deacetylase family protein [Clostridiales bacterium]